MFAEIVTLFDTNFALEEERLVTSTDENSFKVLTCETE